MEVLQDEADVVLMMLRGGGAMAEHHARSMGRRPSTGVSILVVLTVIGAVLVAVAPSASSQPSQGGASGDEITISRGPWSAAPPASAGGVRRLYASRQRLARQANQGRGFGPGGPAVGATEPQAESSGVLLATAPRNFRNTTAQAVSGILAEPAAAKDGAEVLYLGNRPPGKGVYLSRSANNGSTWVTGTPPSNTTFPRVCCDADVVHHAGLDTTFASMLYLNSAETNGAVTILVRRGAMSVTDCVYTVNPSGATTIPDYPHLAVGKNFVYLTINRVITHGTTNQDLWTWDGAEIIRYRASDLANCVMPPAARSYTVKTGEQRVWTPVENAGTTMFWAAMDNYYTLKIYRWPESATTPTASNSPQLDPSNFSDPDCRGGKGNFDWTDEASYSIVGFSMRGAVGGSNVLFLWNVGRDGPISSPQGHMHGAAFRTSDLALVAQPHVSFQGACAGFPALSGNSQGDFALSLAIGGRSGGLGTGTACSSSSTCAARGFVSIDDEDTSGIGFGSFTLTANGTHNPSNGRFGDYFTVRKADNCPLGWVATNYSLLNGNTSSANVNARYVEMHSSHDPACP